MVEVLSNWDAYVTNPTAIAQRGATYIFDEAGEVLYEYRHRGVLTFSETMARPLSFLAPYIGEAKALNPLGLGDASDGGATRGRGLLKAAGKFMSLLGPIFSVENKLQASAFGVDDASLEGTKAEIEQTISSQPCVIYTYGLSPFSSEAVALLEDLQCKIERVEIGPEWFLLGARGSAQRAALLQMTGQSSLPHVFIGGEHMGGIFSGPSGGRPGIAALQEAGELSVLLKTAGALSASSETAVAT
mmetsp:Transcript_41182/g.120373  ORF Transcript_41182/g.120373 Transcript_41182/m.120373 type:complete len:245 (+) Transcript_41182:38-772(+)